MSEGKCRLSGEFGRYVKAHIIPQAFTKPSVPNEPFVQGGDGHFAKRVWSSWYDNRMVTREGEDRLSALDDYAVRELRRHRLVWSGFGAALSVETDTCSDDGRGLRTVEFSDPNRLRVFFLSLLWRAAVTRLPGFEEISVQDSELSILKEIILNSDASDLNFYPVSLVQINNRGFPHNLSPIAMTKQLPKLDGPGEVDIKFVRFYFDGLIAHIHLIKGHDDELMPYYQGTCVGIAGPTPIATVSYETSFERENFDLLVSRTKARDKHRVIDYLQSPVAKAAHEAGREK